MKENRKTLGTQGEMIVQKHLERLGWQVLLRNFRCAAGEMDVIAEEPTTPLPTLVFVEVKTRRGQKHGTPAEAVHPQKQAKLIAIAQAYLAERNAGGEEPNCRFDVAEVRVGGDGLATVTLQKAAFGGE